jgi:hypothetical protein
MRIPGRRTGATRAAEWVVAGRAGLTVNRHLPERDARGVVLCTAAGVRGRVSVSIIQTNPSGLTPRPARGARALTDHSRLARALPIRLF